MKKILALALVLVISLSLSGCKKMYTEEEMAAKYIEGYENGVKTERRQRGQSASSLTETVLDETYLYELFEEGGAFEDLEMYLKYGGDKELAQSAYNFIYYTCLDVLEILIDAY